MLSERDKILVDSIKRLMRRGAFTHMRKIINKTHAADPSVVFRSLTLNSQRKQFNMIDSAVATGPFVTTAIDIISVLFCFEIATIFLSM